MVYARFSLPSWSVRYRCYHAYVRDIRVVYIGNAMPPRYSLANQETKFPGYSWEPRVPCLRDMGLSSLAHSAGDRAFRAGVQTQ
jgi:hypothetical protein